MTPAVSSRSACDVSQFWQYPQWKSQPSIPNVSVSLPGRQWKNGFFSVGSHCSAATYPAGANSVPSLLKRTLQMPRRPGFTRQRWPHAKQRTAPPASCSINSASRTRVSSACASGACGVIWVRKDVILRGVSADSPVSVGTEV
jgi:hypothetical protein